jgi:hypothetical protein
LALRVAEMPNERRCSEAALPRLFTRAVDNLDNRPTRAFVTD